MKKKSIIRKSVWGLIRVAVFILAGVSIVSALTLYSALVARYREMAYSYLFMATEEVGGDYLYDLVYHRSPILEAINNSTPLQQDTENLTDEEKKLFEQWWKTNIFLAETIVFNESLDHFQIFIPVKNNKQAIVVWDERRDIYGENLAFTVRSILPEELEVVERFQNTDWETTFDKDLAVRTVDGKLTGTAIYPVYDSEGAPIAFAELDVSLSDIIHTILQTMGFIGLVLAVIIVISLSLYYKSIRKRIIRPILMLDEAASGIVDKLKSGDSVQKLDIHTGDELESLASSFEKMSGNLRGYIDENAAFVAEQEHIRFDLEMAASIQKDMLPKEFPAFPDRTEFDIYASMTPAKNVGGDFYNYFLINHSTLVLVIADVSGKGIPASLFMMRSMLMIESLASQTSSPSTILGSLNNLICDKNESDMFVTVWLGILNLETGLLKATNAGHEFPIIRKPGGPFKIYKDRHSFLVGAKKNVTYREYELTLTPGTTLFLYTDGLPEAKNSAGEMFRLPAVAEALNKAPNGSPSELLETVTADVNDFVKDAEQFDDLTMLAFQYNGITEEERKSVEYVKDLTVEAATENFPAVAAFLTQELQTAGCPEKTSKQIRIAAEELFVNIALYAYENLETSEGGYRDKNGVRNPVYIKLRITDARSKAAITFMDKGIPFDPLATKDPNVTLKAKDRKIGGLGIYLTKKLMDTVRYRYKDGKNMLTITKSLK